MKTTKTISIKCVNQNLNKTIMKNGLLVICTILLHQMFQGCVTPGVSKRINDLEKYKEEKETYHNIVMKDSAEYFNIVFRKNNRIGVIFDRPSNNGMAIDSAKEIIKSTYIPDMNVIEKCDMEIYKSFSIGKVKSNMLVYPAYIVENYDKYIRQYFGSINGNDTIVEIKAALYGGEQSILYLYNEIDAWGGGERYWYANCNISNKKFIISDLGTNWIE